MLQLLTLNPRGAPAPAAAELMCSRDAVTPKPPPPVTSRPLLMPVAAVSTSRRCDRNFSSRRHFARRLENHTCRTENTPLSIPGFFSF